MAHRVKFAAAFVVKFEEISTIDIDKSINTEIGRNINGESKRALKVKQKADISEDISSRIHFEIITSTDIAVAEHQ